MADCYHQAAFVVVNAAPVGGVTILLPGLAAAQVLCAGHLVKRGLHGTYVSLEPFHLFRYVDEQAYRYNNRKDEDGEPISDFDRFTIACSQIVGKRLTWNQLTGNDTDSPTCVN
jgi:hypothetical protein